MLIRGYFLVLLDFFYFLKAIESAAVDAGTFLGRDVPGIGAGEVARPERPGPALVRANWVNNTFFAAFNFPQEHTISGARLLNNCRAKADAFQAISPKLSGRGFEEICNDFNFRSSHPDITLARPRAAVAALHTFKMQTGNIPRSFTFLVRHRFTRLKLTTNEYESTQIQK